jgi:hypothetical protein
MGKWLQFLNSLATRGGAIFILLILVLSVDVGAFILHLRGEISIQALIGILSNSGVMGALLLALKGSSDSSASASVGPSGSIVTTTTADTKTNSVTDPNVQKV